MGLFDSIGKIVSNVASGVGDFVSTASKFSNALNPINTAVTAIGGLFDNKDAGNNNPFGGGGSAFGSFSPPPVPIETTTNTGAGPFAGGQSALGAIGMLSNQGSGSSITPRPPFQNQNSAVETAQSSIQAGNFLAPIGTGLNILGKATGFFNRLPSFGVNYKIPAIGDILGDDDNRSFSNLITDFDISKETGDNMAYGVGGQGALTIPQTMPMQQGNAFFSPVLGRIGISSKGNIIITRRLKNQFKALADNVGLAQASNLAGVPLEVGAMILTKRFATRGKSISTKKMQECARTYKRITNFYNMIPRRTATRTTRAKTMRGASTVIQNS
tara:strand:- start:458 stop:1444 length:987 start_codon:yes stop_codon:yes gene_type:complete